MLNTVRTPKAFRTGATFFIAGWLIGANIKPIPHFSILSATFAAESSSFIPKVSSTSAEPHLLDTLLLPAFAILQPQAAASTAAAVDMLIVSAPSPPVPTISRSFPRATTVSKFYILNF